MIAALARLPAARLTRSVRGALAVGGWTALTFAIACLARSRGAAHGADHVLIGAYAPVVLPLLAYGIVGIAVGSRSLSAAIAPLVSFGASPTRAAAVTVAIAVTACAAAGAILASAIALLAHGVADPPRLGDALRSGYAGALGGGAYGALFSLGSNFGRRGGGRTVLLACDWVLGANAGALALLTPRAHLRSLLGGLPPMAWSEQASAAALVVLTTIGCALAIRRAQG
ncbi:MAG: hypothetical protein ACREJ3_13910 [Polyangiaceae bacterium]